MNRQKDFFNEATKQIRDSYVFQSDGTYSDDDVRDIATSLAEYGYQYAIEKAEEWIKKNVLEFEYQSIIHEFNECVKDFRKTMTEEPKQTPRKENKE